MNTIKARWDDFLVDVVPSDAGPIQRAETENAFYAGCAAMFGLMTGDIADMGEEGAMGAMDGLHDEITSFMAGIEDDDR